MNEVAKGQSYTSCSYPKVSDDTHFVIVSVQPVKTSIMPPLAMPSHGQACETGAAAPAGRRHARRGGRPDHGAAVAAAWPPPSACFHRGPLRALRAPSDPAAMAPPAGATAPPWAWWVPPSPPARTATTPRAAAKSRGMALRWVGTPPGLPTAQGGVPRPGALGTGGPRVAARAASPGAAPPAGGACSDGRIVPPRAGHRPGRPAPGQACASGSGPAPPRHRGVDAGTERCPGARPPGRATAALAPQEHRLDGRPCAGGRGGRTGGAAVPEQGAWHLRHCEGGGRPPPRPLPPAPGAADGQGPPGAAGPVEAGAERATVGVTRGGRLGGAAPPRAPLRLAGGDPGRHHLHLSCARLQGGSDGGGVRAQRAGGQEWA